MALDKVVDSAVLDAGMASVADAIRSKAGTSTQLAFPAGFVDAIAAIPTGGVGGGVSVLEAISVTQNVHALKIDFDVAWEPLDIIIVVYDLTFSTGDWLYLGYDTQAPSNYSGNNLRKKWGVSLSIKNNGVWTSKFMTYTGESASKNGFPAYLYLVTYEQTNQIESGSHVVVYGGNIA